MINLAQNAPAQTYPGMPVGSVIAFAGEIRKQSSTKEHETNLFMFNWLECNGQKVEIAAYPELYHALGGRYGSVGKTTFTLPDYRGMFLRGVGTSKFTDGSDESRTDHSGNKSTSVGSKQRHALQDHTHGYKKPQAGSPLVADPAASSIFTITPAQTETPDTSGSVLTSDIETRAVNTSVYWLIKAKL